MNLQISFGTQNPVVPPYQHLMSALPVNDISSGYVELYLDSLNHIVYCELMLQHTHVIWGGEMVAIEPGRKSNLKPSDPKSSDLTTESLIALGTI